VLIRIGHGLLIVALLAATGGHWALLQTVAWSNMLASNLRTDSFSEAVAKTFDGRHPCKMCQAISAGKKSEKKTEFPSPGKRLEFICERGAFVFAAPSEDRLVTEVRSRERQLPHRPPVPPPRSHCG
jgi:hypothetical protein